MEYGVRGRYTVPVKRADYIAKTAGTRTFPWRVLAITDRDIDFLENDLAQCLAPECRIEDISWIKPGKTSWEWWSGKHITGVDFKVGTNTETYKYFVDFSADNGLEYILIDAGWSSSWFPGFVKRAAEQGVECLLWQNANLDKSQDFSNENMDATLKKWKGWGIKGIKVDFWEDDSRTTMIRMENVLKTAAKYQMMVNFHGCTRPSGLRRTYPHLMSQEAVYGAEQYNNASYMTDNGARINCLLPYTRNVVGPMDYTPVAFTHSQHPHRTSFAHELALSVAFESGIQH
ncbi:MAG: glycoside hydrolase family 97 catalytic domain-containing protein, partial [Prevotella sp.]